MPNVLTTDSTISCGHGAGKVNIPTDSAQTKLKVAGNPVLLESDIAGQQITECTTTDTKDTSSTPLTQPCKLVSAINVGGAKKLTVGEAPVMLDSLQGLTNGMLAKVSPQPLGKAVANQNKLKAS